MGRIWLIGGTQESAQLARALATAPLPHVVTVTTETATALYAPASRVWVGRLSPEQLPVFLAAQGITAILDASHPYAVEVSKLAISAADQFHLPYLRYERPELANNEMGHDAKILELDSFETLLAGSYLTDQRVLLTVGCRTLPKFQPWQDRTTLFARILPSQETLAIAQSAGFTPDRLIALRPPISAALEIALWQQWQISTVVTKASGKAGGEDQKRKAARELGVLLIVIARPSLTYPQQTSNVAVAIEFCQQCLGE